MFGHIGTVYTTVHRRVSDGHVSSQRSHVQRRSQMVHSRSGLASQQEMDPVDHWQKRRSDQHDPGPESSALTSGRLSWSWAGGTFWRPTMTTGISLCSWMTAEHQLWSVWTRPRRETSHWRRCTICSQPNQSWTNWPHTQPWWMCPRADWSPTSVTALTPACPGEHLLYLFSFLNAWLHRTTGRERDEIRSFSSFLSD